MQWSVFDWFVPNGLEFNFCSCTTDNWTQKDPPDLSLSFFEVMQIPTSFTENTATLIEKKNSGEINMTLFSCLGGCSLRPADVFKRWLSFVAKILHRPDWSWCECQRRNNEWDVTSLIDFVFKGGYGPCSAMLWPTMVDQQPGQRPCWKVSVTIVYMYFQVF